MTIEKLIAFLRRQKFILDNEKHLQEQMFTAFRNELWTDEVEREVWLTDQGADVIDFRIGTIGIEVKIRSNKRKIYKQCVRYCDTGKLTTLILFTSTTVGMPRTINGVDIFVINPSHAWL